MEPKREDPIVVEIRAVRVRYAAQFDYDVDAIFRDLRRRQGVSGRTYVQYPSRPATDPAPPKRAT